MPSIASNGDSPTAPDPLSELLEPGRELPPELEREQRAVQLQPGDVVIERFEVIEMLGFGGMGAVYKVRDRDLGQFRALKVMLPSLLGSDKARERFLSEITISQKLRHDGVVAVHDFGKDTKRGIQFFTMEYVEGKTLHRELRDRGGELPVAEALAITSQLCDALEYAHQQTIHRDLKPQNIMLQPDGRIKVLDFGLAKLMSPGRLTKSSMALGTAYYQAPEQSVHLTELDQRADIYSVGVMLYQMLTGRIPLGAVEVPSRVNRHVPKALDAVVMTCLRPQAEDRYDSVVDLRNALKAASRKRRGPPVFAAVLIVLAVAAVGYYTYFGTPFQAKEATTLPTPIDTDDPVTSPPPVTPPPGAAEPEGSEVTATGASHAKTTAMQARSGARDAGAEDHATSVFTEAEELLKEGEAHDTLKAFDEAVAKYAASGQRFTEAAKEATRITGEIAALNGAKAEMVTAKTNADRLDASQWAKTRYEQAREAEQSASTGSDRVAAAERYGEAEELYKLAVAETRQQGDAIVAAARRDAKSARTQARTSDVSKYASNEVAAGDNLMSDAEGAGSDFQAAKGLYEKASAKYLEAVEVTPGRRRLGEERIAKARQGVADAREKAFRARGRIGDDERKHAETEVASGDRAWASAERAGDDYSEAERMYEIAEREYAKAVQVTPERKRAAQQPKAGDTRTFSGIEMVWVPSGSFQMGSPSGEKGRGSDEGPQHRVMLTKGYWLGKYEVTNAQYRRYKRSHSSGDYEGHDLNGNSQPVVEVSWDDAKGFCDWLLRETGEGFRLPTEAEWEYACRAGTTTSRYWGNDETSMGQYANVADRTAKSEWSSWTTANTTDGYKVTAPVGSFKPNAFGLHDMIGNVWEWCQDWKGDYLSGSVTDPMGPSTGSSRVYRGGGWHSSPRSCRSASRGYISPDFRFSSLGFRLAR